MTSRLPNGKAFSDEPAIYNRRFTGHSCRAFGETFIPQAIKRKRKQDIMGDKSPKANQKKSSQKQSKASSSAASKQAAVSAKQAAGKKK
jgi:hypothetical protein